MDVKVCTKCGQTKPRDTDHFYLRKTKQGFQPICRECRKAHRRKRYAADAKFREKEKAKQRAPEVRARQNELRRERYANDADYRENVKAYMRTPEVRAKANQRLRERRANDPKYREKTNAAGLERYHANKEDIAARSRERWASDPEYRERKLAAQKEHYRENRQAISARSRERWATDPEYRERRLATQKERYHNDPVHREAVLSQQRQKRASDPRVRERDRERYANDPQYRERKLVGRKNHYHNNADYREKVLAWQRTPEVREKKNQRNRERWANDPDYRERLLSVRRERYHNDPQYRRMFDNNRLVRAYGITRAELERKERDQNGRCAICPQDSPLVVDHNHDTNQVRDLLCQKCNSGIGYFEENSRFMLAAVEYLRQPWLDAKDVPVLPDEHLFARFEIPHWEEQSRDKQFRNRKNQNLKQHYGITIEQYEWLLAKGSGTCWICSRPEVRKRNPKSQYLDSLHVDHCHRTAMIRGLLCGKCNTAVGAFDDDPERIANAIAYLERWNGLNPASPDVCG